MNSQFDAVTAALSGADRFLVTTHVGRDGDAIVSVLMTVELLERMGKHDVYVFHPEGEPRGFVFLNDREWHDEHPADLAERTAVVLDASTLDRTGELRLAGAALMVVIDHHETNVGFGDVNLVAGDAAATCEILGLLADHLGLPWNRRLAELLYVGIHTDTEGLTNLSVTPRSLALAERAVEAGAELAALREQIESVPPAWQQYLALAQRKRVEPQPGLVIVTLDDDDVAASGVDPLDGLAAARYVVNSLGGEIVALVFPHGDDEQHVELRSRDPAVGVAEVARRRGGGGHHAASGFPATGIDPIQLADELVRELIEARRRR